MSQLILKVGQGVTMGGNCMFWAIGMWLAAGLQGGLDWMVLWGWPPKVRFYYVDADGARYHFFPNEPKSGWAACGDAFWFQGHIRRG